MFEKLKALESVYECEIVRAVLNLESWRISDDLGLLSPRLVIDVQTDFSNQPVSTWAAWVRRDRSRFNLPGMGEPVTAELTVRPSSFRANSPFARPPLIIDASEGPLGRFHAGRHTSSDLQELNAIVHRTWRNFRLGERGDLRFLEIQNECISLVECLVGTKILYDAGVGGVLEPRFPRSSAGVRNIIQAGLPSIGMKPIPKTLNAVQRIMSGASREEVNDLWLSSRRERSDLLVDVDLIHERIRAALSRFKPTGETNPADTSSYRAGAPYPLAACDPELAADGIWDVSVQKFLPIRWIEDEDMTLQMPNADTEVDSVGFSF